MPESKIIKVLFVNKVANVVVTSGNQSSVQYCKRNLLTTEAFYKRLHFVIMNWLTQIRKQKEVKLEMKSKKMNKSIEVKTEIRKK